MTTKKLRITLNKIQSIFLYEGEEFDLVKNSNIPAFDVEARTNWKSHKIGENPNLIGQIHSVLIDGKKGELEEVFHLCHNPIGRFLTKDDLKGIIKGMDYVEKFRKEKKKE